MKYFENLPSIQWKAPAPAVKTQPAKQKSNDDDDDDAANAPTSSGAASKTAPAAAAQAKCAPAPAPPKKEVFNISNNMYTYQDAQEVCHAFGAQLANYDQIEQAYLKNGEWCNYGWSEGQMALMPTQKATWQQLQNTVQKNQCGRPGINGGYIGDDKLQFGANCFGVKPKEPSAYKFDDSLSQLKQLPAAAPAAKAPTKEDLWKATAKLNAFNNLKHTWSQY
jgi:hypothetical protein